MSDIPEEASVLMGTFSINDTPIKILFDSGATNSFLSGKLVGRLGLIGSHIKSAYAIVTLGGKISSHTLTYGVPLRLGSKTVQTNLIVIDLEG
jgi:predicted aspartyl protease